MAEDKEFNEDTKAEEQAENVGNVGNENIEESSKLDPLTELQNEYNELNDKYLRLHAEFDNYRRRTNKEKLDIISSASEGVLKDLLPVLDDFERAIENNDKVDNMESIKEGFHLIYNKLKSNLEAKGLKPMQSIGEPFDSELHEAIANVPAEDKDKSGKIVDDVEKGYFLHDKVIRYAKVVVAQ